MRKTVARFVDDDIVTELSRSPDDTRQPRVALADDRIGSALARLHESPEAHWSVESLARVAVMSRSAFSERFRSRVGETPMRYLTGLRLTRAAGLLRGTDTTIAEIARRVGYASEEALSRSFKSRFGVAPSVFRGLR